ncbi:hypothetical protein [Siminovitchia sp. 179-K 8D1 HS]
MGVFLSVWSVAGLLGPLVGGYFVDQVSWPNGRHHGVWHHLLIYKAVNI